MYKKIILLFIFSFFLMGHTINYEAVIDDKINENINISITKGDIENPSNLIDTIINEDRYVFLNNENNLKYNKTVTKNNDITNVNMKHIYSIKDFEKANYFNSCFENTTFINKNNYLYLKGYGGFYCSSSTGADIKITTDKLVISNNADSVSGNTYIWHVDLKEYDSFVLEFQVDLTKNKGDNSKGNVIISPFKIVIGIIIGIAIVVIIFIINKKKKEEI